MAERFLFKRSWELRFSFEPFHAAGTMGCCQTQPASRGPQTQDGLRLRYTMNVRVYLNLAGCPSASCHVTIARKLGSWCDITLGFPRRVSVDVYIHCGLTTQAYPSKLEGLFGSGGGYDILLSRNPDIGGSREQRKEQKRTIYIRQLAYII
jgi:hypothetical protein